MACLLDCGVHLNEMLTIIREVSTNEVIKETITQVHRAIREGGSLSEALSNEWYIPRYTIDFIKTGEMMGGLQDLLRKSAEMIESEIVQRAEVLLSMIEPIIISILAFVAGFIVIATFLPLYRFLSYLAK